MNRAQRILVVDDDPGMRRALERILAPAYPVELVAGAGEALARLDEAIFDLALVDVRLKDGDGYSLCQAIRARRPHTDVILITGSISEPDEKLFRSLEEGAFYFLFKPFDRRVLLALVLVLAVVAVLFVWVFPRIAPLMPFNDNTVDPSAVAGLVVAHVREA